MGEAAKVGDMSPPAPGLGTSGNTDPDQCAESVRMALEIGYRHIDTAQAYENESAVGEGIRRADIPREDIFVATKIHPDDLAYDRVIETAYESLDRLGLDSIDLLYVHWPVRAYDPTDTLPAFDDLRDRDLISHIGVSNFTPALLETARDILETPLFAHQVEMHPLLPQEELVAHARKHDQHLVAYSPLAQGQIGDVPQLQEVAEKYDATPFQITLAWFATKHGVVPIPKATGEDHLRDNWVGYTIDLDEADVGRIDDIDREERIVDPDYGPWNT